MKYLPIGNELFTENRKNLLKLLPPKSVAILHSNDILPTNADGTLPFIQNSDLFHLSGIDQENSILVLCPDFPEPEYREMLFVTETNEHIAIWEGHKYTKEEATEASGIAHVHWNHKFESMLHLLMSEADQVFLPTNEHRRSGSLISVQTQNDRFIKWMQERYPLHEYQRLSPLMHQLRAIKGEREIEMIGQACKITEAGFRRILGFVKPGVMEYEIEAEYLHEFVRSRSRGFAYTPIIASGANSNVLHYIDNNLECKDGDLLLMDVGAEYANYAADMTRTIPVSGRFTERQRAVYDAVLRVQREAMKILRPGTTIPEYHKEVGKIMESELIGLGLLDRTDVKNQDEASPLYKKYFMHGTSHHLGLDVHDYDNWYRTVEPGMVFTIEPGIYLPDEGFGIRLENDIVIRENGWDDLMGNIPIDAEEIEDLMNK